MEKIVEYYATSMRNKQSAMRIFNDLMSNLEQNNIEFKEFFNDFGVVFMIVAKRPEVSERDSNSLYKGQTLEYHFSEIDKKIIPTYRFSIINIWGKISDYAEKICGFAQYTLANEIVRMEFATLVCEHYYPLAQYYIDKKEVANKHEQCFEQHPTTPYHDHPTPDHERKAFETPNGNTATTAIDHKPKQEQQQERPRPDHEPPPERKITVKAKCLLMWYLIKYEGKYQNINIVDRDSEKRPLEATKSDIERFKIDFGFENATSTYVKEISNVCKLMQPKKPTKEYMKLAKAIEQYIKDYPTAYEHYKQFILK